MGLRRRIIDEPTLRNELIRRGLGPKAIYDYIRACQRAADHIHLHRCSPSDVSRYIEAHVPDTWSSRKLARTALGTYWEVVGWESAPVGAIRVPPKPRAECRAISEERAHRLSEVARRWDQGAEGLAVLMALYPPALRRFEIAKVEWDWVDGDWLKVVGKGNVIADVPLHPLVQERMEWWRGFVIADRTDGRTRPGDRYLFQGKRKGQPISPATVWTWVRRVAEAAGVGHIEPHELRHTCLAEINDRTGNLRLTQNIARHADPATTMIYTRTKKDAMLEAATGVAY